MIEEYAIIFCKDVWFSPLIDLIIIDSIIIEIKKLLLNLYDKIKIGVIFCQVIKIKLLIQDNPDITKGSQKWKGAAPIFIKREVIINKLIIVKFKNSFFKNKNIIIIDNNKIEEAIAWTKKYFNIDSLDIKFLLSDIRGINDNKLISSPIQTPNQEVALIEIKVLIIKTNKNIKFVKVLLIKKKRSFLYSWGMSPKAFLAYLFIF